MKNETNIVTRPSKIQYYLDIAETVAERSTCLRKHWGSIIVKNDEIISSGYNGSPRGITNCIDNGFCYRAKSTRGTGYENCLAVHSEMNSIISASRNEMIGSDIYLVGLTFVGKTFDEKLDKPEYVKNPSPCMLCRKMIINAGIKNVIVRLSKTEYKIIKVENWKEEDLLGEY